MNRGGNRKKSVIKAKPIIKAVMIPMLKFK